LRSKFRLMVRRLTHLLLALLVALATTMSVSARAMPMSANMAGMAVERHCPNSPHERHTGTSPDQMPACQVLACAGAVAILTTPALLPVRVLLRTAYPTALSVRWAAAPSAPDPFPPRPIVLV
jgi:hypothetical protein